jgi:hypothetical protein
LTPPGISCGFAATRENDHDGGGRLSQKVYIQSTIKTQMNIVLLLFWGRLDHLQVHFLAPK